jgi:hypothetical protein
VGAEKGHDIGDSCCSPRRTSLALDVQSIPGFGLEKRGALFFSFVAETQGRGLKLFLGRRSGRGDGRVDAAGGILLAGHAGFELR